MSTVSPLISVIVPCYNYERYVAEAIESVLGQDYPNLEIIAINDGSTDASLAILESYKPRITVIDQPNSGHVAAINRAFTASHGSLIYFLDADDRLEPGALQKVAEASAPGIAKIQFDLKILDAESRDLGRRFCHLNPSYDQRRVRRLFDRFSTYRWPVTAGNVYTRDFLEQVFPLEITEGPDGFLNTIAPLYGEIAVIPEALAAYRMHGENRWTTRGGDESRLPARIARRRKEHAILAEHAARRNVPLSEADPLDHELPFINYRLMAKRLGFPYDGDERDKRFALLLSGLRTIREDRYPLRMAAAHAAWLGALALVPRPLAAPLIQLRFQRAELKRSLSARLPRLVRVTS